MFSRRFLFLQLLIFILSSCNNKASLFSDIPAQQSGITFSNTIKEDAILNPLTYEYIYNGGGVGIGDFNNDSLPDIYFTASTTPNKLYINKGHLKFADYTAEAKVTGDERWCKGVSIVDINNDGWDDIYVACAVLSDPQKRRNLLYLNKAVKGEVPQFEEQASAFGLDDSTSTHMAAFFDYDNDGDLDVYLLENDLNGQYANEFRPIITNGTFKNTDKLLQNTFDSTVGHAVFKNVSAAAGITIEGYGLGVNICDINADGWKDIYVSNDYISNNLLYINQKDGSFKNECGQYFKHTSKNAMGNDVADINNDGLVDVFELDMAPADNYRLKMMMNDASYQNWQNSARFGYMHQYVRNSLQLNLGKAALDSNAKPVFSEIANLSGVAQTDWSWAPLLVDMDNDGFRDLMISNGLPSDISDMDFIAYRENASATTPAITMLQKVPKLQLSNYIFKNNGNLTFADKTKDWGFSTPTYSAGMAYADFDKDGDLDVVCNNTNMPASLLENKSKVNAQQNYINIKLEGSVSNRKALGAMVHIYYGKQHQVCDNTPYRGYMSSIENIVHFGLGSTTLVDSIVVEWNNKEKQKLNNVPANTTQRIAKQNTTPLVVANFNVAQLFTEVSSILGLKHQSIEADFIDFNIQKMLPHKLTQFGPSIAVADINGDSLDDVIVGGGSPFFAKAFIQNSDGTFSKQSAVDSVGIKYQDDASILLFDADSDGDNDLLITSGGAENEPYNPAYNDNFYSNNGKGKFTLAVDALPRNMFPKSAAKAADYDNDGDLDLFIGGRCLPGSYPKPVSSYIYQNNSTATQIQFKNVTATVAPSLINIGLVTDALWTDVNNDKVLDLALVGEYMPLTFLKHVGDSFVRQKTNIDAEKGLFNSIGTADLDADGDMDYVLGNHGLNNFYKASIAQPLTMLSGDFDQNNSYDAILTHYFKSNLKEQYNYHPVFGRDDFLKELNYKKATFTNYQTYATATAENILTPIELPTALRSTATNLNSAWIENKGNFEMLWHNLPTLCQAAPIFGTTCADFNADGFIDIAIAGNDFAMHPFLGRLDGLNGIVLLGNGKGEFKASNLLQSGFYIGGNAKSLATITIYNKPHLLATQNNGPLRCFALNQMVTTAKIPLGTAYGFVSLPNNAQQKIEYIMGSGFQSQSGSSLLVPAHATKIKWVNHKGTETYLNLAP